MTLFPFFIRPQYPSSQLPSVLLKREQLGVILAACALSRSAIDDAFVAEVRACEDAINLAINLDFRSIQVEGDSFTLIKKLSPPSIDKSIISLITTDIISKLGFFENVTFSHVGRQGNQAAHALAQKGSHLLLSRYWIGDAPSVVERIALHDIH
ncbi:hypothetical protein V6N11_058764 [Hibiscus sabdariffa]|uniref:RNase H type-1 domain-containing protein n=1 Tax=Hibiscus sabdariffa TaxID=183260 RepID=A0ABR2U5W8_9ROSI